MSNLLELFVKGIPGPKGSVNAFCVRCAKAKKPPAVIIKEQSEVGAAFRKTVAKTVKVHLVTHRVNEIYTGDIETRLTFFIHRQRRVSAGVELDEWVPSHAGPRPTFRNSGDVEKHARTIHDALMDAGLILDDSQVWRTVSEKRWADVNNPPGVLLEVRIA